jgi:hypothetical protein
MQIKVKKCLYIQLHPVPKKHRYLAVRRASADCASADSNMQMASGLDHWWNDLSRERRKHLQKNLHEWRFVYQEISNEMVWERPPRTGLND